MHSGFALFQTKTVQVVILAGGRSSRFKTGISKLITPICGQPMIAYVVQLMHQLAIPTTIVLSYQHELVKKAIDEAQVSNLNFIIEEKPLGTSTGLLASKDKWIAKTILVMMGDLPLITPEIVNKLIEEHHQYNAAITISASHKDSYISGFGRFVQCNDRIQIVEEKDFTYDIKDYPLVNTGVYVIDREFLETFLSNVELNEKTKEFRITSLVKIASDNKLPVRIVEFPFDPSFNGVNTFSELAVVEQIKRDEIIHYWMTRGVRFIAPHTVHIDVNVTIGRGTVISSGVQLLNNTVIGEFCTINPHVVLDNARLENQVSIGAHSVIKDMTILQDTSLVPMSYLFPT